MKKLSRIISIFVSLALLASTALFAFAQNNQTKIIVQNVIAGKGETVNVDVEIRNNPGILGAIFTLEYSDHLTLVNATSGDAFSSLVMTPPGRFTSPCNFTWDGLDLADGEIKDGIILSLEFAVSDEATIGENCEVSLSYRAGNIIDRDLNSINPIVENANITIMDGNCIHNYNSVITQPTQTQDGYITYTCSICGHTYKTYPDELRATGGIADGPAIVVNNVQASAGDTVVVDVEIKNNPGVLGAILTLEYSEYLTLTSASSGEAFSALAMTPPGRFESPCNFTWDGLELTADDIRDGIILSLTFEVSENVPDGTQCNVNLSYKNGDIIDNDLSPISFSIVNGNVLIEENSSSEHEYIILENIEPTCEEAGLIIYECIDCGEIYIEEPEALGHIVVVDEACEVTCTEDGKTEGSHCSRCEKVFVAQEIIKATGHDLRLYRKTVTCEKNGYEIYKCTVCSKLINNQVSAYGHDYAFDRFDGEEIAYICTDCANEVKLTPDEFFVIWDSKYINTTPQRGTESQFLDVVKEKVINAKDYAKIHTFEEYGW